MMKKFDSRYNSKSTATHISQMAELLSIRYRSVQEDMAKHVDRMAGLLEQLRSMSTMLDDSLAIAIIFASIEMAELLPITAAITTLADRDLN